MYWKGVKVRRVELGRGIYEVENRCDKSIWDFFNLIWNHDLVVGVNRILRKICVYQKNGEGMLLIIAGVCVRVT